ncbi:hypothetical protein EHW99_2683 [Erwinia amylovora]|uniref:Uncharacterized protein n=2 Tax=Erwinia amylovora TaxID=552 RepID=A0A831EQ38_ERWAM|nr:hypothetical protein EaACW_0906 [Erwinia amylovora ACW56400]QJQ55385.1 hypothetical protein EHX00_2683 [Erwinia amylovora]CBA19847.1 hypothetical protein predicted by Glimmer/Critica [Erwinia amylovora CFBP1430]CCO77749.1 hypothetical protein BN432_0927 [Erwinia amylovora Ea356]CCO81535.1 hypothetical protein BN433_0940 [Erwinia amylovora Ea266]CCO85337.1 hypothetical protein BN434_0925 [Erwinia amylovora CFBP 2585]CCO89121.1 hypothetical protein BN435_0925 [Erwinia amylovora 01SFR-BO]CCO
MLPDVERLPAGRVEWCEAEHLVIRLVAYTETDTVLPKE